VKGGEHDSDLTQSGQGVPHRAATGGGVDRGATDRPAVVISASPQGLLLYSHWAGWAIAHRQPGRFEPATIAIPVAALASCEGAGDAPVTIESADGRVRLAWQDRGVPKVAEHAAEPLPLALPPMPDKPAKLDARFLRAFDDALRCTDRTPGRYDLNCLQLQGRRGAVVATNGRELFREDGFALPWIDDILVPRNSVFTCNELRQHPPTIGRTTTHVVVTAGPWSVLLPIATKGTFPNIDQVIPKVGPAATHWRLDEQDAETLVRGLPELPGHGEPESPITVELDDKVSIRARAAEGPPATIVLSRSTVQGKPVRWAMNRSILRRSVAMGMREFAIVHPDKAIVGQCGNRLHLFMPFHERHIVPADSPVVSPVPAGEPEARPVAVHEAIARIGPGPQHNPRRCAIPVPERSADGPPDKGGLIDVIEEMSQLQDALRDALARTARLSAALKLQRRQTRVVQSTLATLRQLPALG